MIAGARRGVLVESDVSATVRSVTNAPKLPRRRRAPSALSRLFALLVLALSLLAQQRVARAAHLATMTASPSASERAERIESTALHVEISLRVARAPFLARLPVLPPAFTPFGTSPRRRSLRVRAARRERAQLCTHFHAKRRIPRMNSEEPPRRVS